MEVRICRASAVIVQRVPAESADWFMQWQQRVTATVEQFPGYSGTDIYPPSEKRQEWVAVLHFLDDPALQKWLDSSERTDLLKELREKIGEFQLERITGGFAEWFVEHTPSAQRTPGWKMVMTVVLALYPTVMLLHLAFHKLWDSLNTGMALSMLFGNMMSVSILQWIVMPQLTKIVAPWLNASGMQGRTLTIIGALVIVVLWAISVLIFFQFTG